MDRWDYEESFGDFIEPYAVSTPDRVPLHARLRQEAPLWCTRDSAARVARSDRKEVRHAPQELRLYLRKARRYFFESRLRRSGPLAEALSSFEEVYYRREIPKRIELLLFGEGETEPEFKHSFLWFKNKCQSYHDAKKVTKERIRGELTQAAASLCQELGLLPAFPKGKPARGRRREEVREMYHQGRFLFEQLTAPGLASVETRVQSLLGPEANWQEVRTWEAHFRLPMLAHKEIRAGLLRTVPLAELVVQGIARCTGLEVKTVQNYVRDIYRHNRGNRLGP